MPVTLSRRHRAVLLSLLGMFFSFGAPVAAQQNSSPFGTLSDCVPVSEKLLRPGLRELPDAERPPTAERDRWRGALYGSAIGAVVGGVGFAAVTFIANQGGEGEDYWPLALLVGSVPGGAVGLVAGAIIGAPEPGEGSATAGTAASRPGPVPRRHARGLGVSAVALIIPR